MPTRIVPADWMPVAKMQRIIVHWTAGTHDASALDRSHYHILIDATGRLVRGGPPISGNSASAPRGERASHTLNCNTGSIGVSLCCMGGAIESPFKAGRWPMKRAQWDTLAFVLADLCERYKIAIGPKTVLSHAEVQGNLGIHQRGKWDISRLAFDPSVVGAKACGDLMRRATLDAMAGIAPAQPFASPDHDDGGEPEDPPIPPDLHGAPDDEVLQVQQKLQQLGYYEVGQPDGEWGGKTTAAIAAFKNDRGLDGSPTIDAALMEEFERCFADGWSRPISPARATITAEKMAPKVPAVRQSLRQWAIAKWTAFSSFVTGAFIGISNQVGGVSDYVRPLKALFLDVPGWLWFALIGGIAVLVWMNARWTTEAIVDDKRTGRLN